MNHYCSDVEHDHHTAMPRGENSPDTRGENSSDKDFISDNGDENIDKTNNEAEDQNSDVEVDD
jgi:hypothetical protein